MKKYMLPLLLLSGWFQTSALKAAEQEITVRLNVPDSAWTLKIEEIWKVDGEIRVLAAVSRDPDRMGAQVITELKSSRKVEAPEAPVKIFIVGKTWGWENEEKHRFLENRKAFEKLREKGERLFPPQP